MKLTAQALAAILPQCLANPLDHTDEDKALAEAAIEILSPNGSSREADGLRAAADLARDFRLLVAELQNSQT